LKDKDKIFKAVEEAPCLPRRKRFKASSFPEIEHAMTEWMKRVRDYNLPISGPLIQEKAAEFAKNLGLTFQAIINSISARHRSSTRYGKIIVFSFLTTVRSPITVCSSIIDARKIFLRYLKVENLHYA